MSKTITSFGIDDVPYDDTRDFDNASKGFIATRKDPIIKNKKGRVVTVSYTHLTLPTKA